MWVWVWVRVRVGVRSVHVPLSLSGPVRGACHVSRPLIQRVQVFLLKALLQIGHAGVRVLPVITPSTATTTTAATSAPRPSTPASTGSTAAMSRRGRWHALKGLSWWGKLGAHGVS